MKEKQYFCDFIFSKSDFNFIRQCFFIIFFSFWIIIPISLIIYNNIIMSKYEYELNSYSEDTYKYITDIAKNAIQEGIGIDLNAIPEDIEYDITRKSDEIIFSYYLDNDMIFADSVTMTIKLSNNFDIISRESNYFYKDKYIESVQSSIDNTCFYYSFITWIAIIIFVILCMIVTGSISLLHKNKNLS